MTSATAVRGSFGRPEPAATPTRGRRRSVLTYVLVVAIVLVVWEGVKFLGGVPWREPGALPGAPVLWNPPFRWAFASDLKLPHVWNIILALGQPWQRGADIDLAQYLFGAAIYTWREAVIGFAFGALLGLAAGDDLRPRQAARAGLRAVRRREPDHPDHRPRPDDRLRLRPERPAVVVIATYLTFFPVTIAMIRGLRSLDPRALELMRSYAASTLDDLLQGPPARIAAVPVHRAEDRGDGEHRRGDHRRGHRAASRTASAASSRPSTSTTSPGPRSCGPRSSPRRCSGSPSSPSIRVAEILVLRGRPGAAAG